MKPPKLLEVRDVPLDDIHLGDNRLRYATVEGAQAMAAVLSQTGVQTSNIDVRQVRHQDKRLVLIAGGHRLGAAMIVEWPTIRCNIWDCTDDQARDMEIDDNLAFNELSPLDLAVFLAEKKRVYEKMYPETKAGSFKGNRHTGVLVAELSSVTRIIAEKRGISERQVRKIVSAAEGLNAEEIRFLQNGTTRPTLNDLLTIGKVTDGKKRSGVVDQLISGQAKSAAEALATFAPKKPDADPIDKAHLALLTLWKRTPRAAQQRFVRDAGAELNKMLEAHQ